MTALRNLSLSFLIWGLLTLPATAAPVSSAGNSWAWWSTAYSSPATSNWSPVQFASSFYGPSVKSSSTPAPVVASASPPAAAPAPVPVAAPAPVAASTPVAASVPAAYSTTSIAAPPTTPVADAYVNLGTGPYPLASQITTGNAQPWYNSSQISSLFGGQQPSAQQISAFNSAVMQRVEQSFQLSGVSVNLTSNPSVPAAHTLSLVSNTSSNTSPGVIGMTQVGASGFSFIDQQAKSAQSLDQLEWIAAHNLSHELMLAFGVGENYDQTGNYIDARNATWAMMTSPDSTFSQAAAQALALALSSNNTGTTGLNAAQLIDAQPVPEPTTVVCWLAGLSAAFLLRRKAVSARQS